MRLSPSSPTFRGVHRILLAGKNMQALARLYYDLLPLLERDPRLHLAFTVIPGSHFEWAAHRFIGEREREGGAVVVDWSKVDGYAPGLVVSCSPTAELFALGVPFMVVTHGAGNNRLREDLSGVYGLAPEQLLGLGRVVDWLPLAGRAALEQLAEDCPGALEAAEVVGDLCYQRLWESRDRKSEYRRALGIPRDRLFVVMSSTWGELSLVGESKLDLLERLFRELPRERFTVGAVPHPNLEHGEGPSIAGLLGPRLGNGLVMPQVHEGWRALIAAADLVLGDSGSVTQYAGAIGLPIMLAAFGAEQMPEAGALAGIGKTAPWLRTDLPLAPQLIAAHARGAFLDFGDIIARDLDPAARIVAKSYEMLGLSHREPPAPEALPDPGLHARCGPSRSWRAEVRFAHGRADCLTFPVSEPEEARGLVVVRYDACRDRRLLAKAKVLLHHGAPLERDEALLVLDELLDHWSGCRIASVRVGEGHLILAVRNGPWFEVRCDASQTDVVPAVLEAWLGEFAPDPAGLGAPDALVDFEGRFEPPPTLRPLRDRR
ncbi:hypothetical protein [Glycomyces paridis]|uniref:Uncharacterized protein n=1 Tax=Glycomyces paridis TaxID=2126555 RepID=A0A4S8PJQ7_9ACTN|nr:hypothetical protein [Glycomyces paridis]THV29995.1 hypothetical protein E9998_06320 [Glycomyces paridis]